MHCTGVLWEPAYGTHFQARGSYIELDVNKRIGEEPGNQALEDTSRE